MFQEERCLGFLVAPIMLEGRSGIIKPTELKL